MIKKLLVIGGLATVSLATVATGCVVSARPVEPVTVSYNYGGWNAQYYNGNVVYFDSYGRPYYYYGGSTVYVPATWYGYNNLVRYYSVNRHVYTRWHTRYHSPRYYRAPARHGHVRTHGTTHHRGTVHVRTHRRR